MDAEFANAVRVERDRMGLTLTNVEAESFAIRVIACFARACAYAEPSRITMTNGPDMMIDLRLHRSARIALVADIAQRLIDPPPPAPPAVPLTRVQG